MYQVENAGGKVTKFTVSIIAESMYAQCNVDGNEYFLLDLLVNYLKDNIMISLKEGWFHLMGDIVLKKNCIWCRLLNLLLHRGLTTSHIITGGLSKCSKERQDDC